jgi:hypothetical protein
MNGIFTFCDVMEFDGPFDGGIDARKDLIHDPPIDDPNYLKLMAESNDPLYEGNELNRFIGALMILNTCATHRVTNGFVDKLFSLLQKSIVPNLNNLFTSHYEAKSLIQNPGLGYVIIHACENGCVLYRKEHNVV